MSSFKAILLHVLHYIKVLPQELESMWITFVLVVNILHTLEINFSLQKAKTILRVGLLTLTASLYNKT